VPDRGRVLEHPDRDAGREPQADRGEDLGGVVSQPGQVTGVPPGPGDDQPGDQAAPLAFQHLLGRDHVAGRALFRGECHLRAPGQIAFPVAWEIACMFLPVTCEASCSNWFSEAFALDTNCANSLRNLSPCCATQYAELCWTAWFILFRTPSSSVFIGPLSCFTRLSSCARSAPTSAMSDLLLLLSSRISRTRSTSPSAWHNPVPVRPEVIGRVSNT